VDGTGRLVTIDLKAQQVVSTSAPSCMDVSQKFDAVLLALQYTSTRRDRAKLMLSVRGSNEIVEYDDGKKTCDTVVTNASLKGETF
jgi:hypothetical protein